MHLLVVNYPWKWISPKNFLRKLNPVECLSMCSKNWHSGIFFIEEIFTNISTKMHSMFPNILLATISSNVSLWSNLYSFIGVAPLRHSRIADPMSDLIFSLIIWFSVYNLENISLYAHQKCVIDNISILDWRFPTFRISYVMFTIVFYISFI